jgi:hypothetical protein
MGKSANEQMIAMDKNLRKCGNGEIRKSED